MERSVGYTIDHTSAAVSKYFLSTFRQPQHFIALKNAGIFVSNFPDWTETVKKTTDYLNANLTKGESFFALPYEPLYYFLTEKESPVREIFFFDCINMPPEQEAEIIRALEYKKISWVVLSNRQKSGEPGLGTFGQTYCPRLADYTHRNFSEIAAFGNWDTQAGWAWNHAIKILKRIKKL